MRYVMIRYPTHWAVIDNANNGVPVYETRRMELAQRERDRLNREEERRRWSGSADTTQWGQS